MTRDIYDLLNERINSLNMINPSDIPNIDLYMDQVTTFMDSNLACFKRSDEDKILTKTMINNYAKNDVLPSPVKKKYTKDHMVFLILIYYLKNVVAISDIKSVLDPISEKYFGKDNELFKIYEDIFGCRTELVETVKKDVEDKLAKVGDVDREIKELKLIAMLTFDITLKKQLIESIIDTNNKEKADKEKEKNAKAEKEKNTK